MTKKEKAQEQEQEEREPIFHTTRMGHTIEILPIPPFLMDKINASIKYPEIPTYEAKTAAGEIEIFPHDETTLESDEDRKAWAAYQSALTAASEAENDIMMRTMMLKGIDVKLSGDAFENWKDEQEYLGLEIPTNKSALKVYYIETEILGNNQDIADIMTKIVEASGVSQEVVANAKEKFRSAVSGETPESIEAETREMDA